MNIPESFFKEEVRNGFTVTSEMKKLWAVELDIVKEIERICKKYNIKYFAFGGTLLGAIRHKGFIPWDDDIDLAMLRKDYEIFQKVAAVELKPPYFLQSPYTDDGYGTAHIKIRNSSTTGATKYEFKFGFNKGIFVDIFPIDRIPDDDTEYKKMCLEAWDLKKKLDIGVKGYYYWCDVVYTDEEKKEANEYIKRYGQQVAFSNMEDICRRYNSQHTKRCSWLAYHLLDDIYYDCSDFEETVSVPFEFTDIVVPKAFDKILTRRYGDYMKPVRGGAFHSDLIVSTTIPYDKYDFKVE